MMRLAFLLLGAQSVRPLWRRFAAAGALWAAIGAGVLADLNDGAVTLTLDALGALLGLHGAVVALAALPAGRGRRRWDLARGAALIAAGGLLWGAPLADAVAAAALGLAFLADGAVRTISATLLRAPRWRSAAAGGAAEAVAAGAILIGWPLPHQLVSAFVLGMLFLVSGLALLRLSLELRALPLDASATTLPHVEARNRPEARNPAPLSAPQEPPRRGALLVHVWTARGTLPDAERRPIFDRYVVAVDRRGTVSTGHSSIEAPPDLYISHYPADDIDHSTGDLPRLLKAGVANDLAGRFQPSLAVESAAWQPPTDLVTLHRYNDAALRRWWAVYSRDATYNLTSRNCSTTAAQALDVATEGLAATGRPWRDLARLLSDPDFWALAAVRGRADEMTWTPGLVLDYARLLAQVLERDGRDPT